MGPSANPAGRADEAENGMTVTRGLWRVVTVGSPKSRPRVQFGSILPWLTVRIHRLMALAVMHAVGPLRNRSDEPTYARARVESVKIEEKYKYRQEISLNADVSEVGAPTGQLKIVLPYDGDEFFTRDAYADVDTARRDGVVPADEAPSSASWRWPIMRKPILKGRWNFRAITARSRSRCGCPGGRARTRPINL